MTIGKADYRKTTVKILRFVVLVARQMLYRGPHIQAELADVAKRILKARARRNEFLDTDLFGEPAWNMMLDLFIAQAAGNRLTVSDATLGSGAPHATATRWLQRMAAAGMIERMTDPRDARRVFVELTPSATRRITAYLETLDPRTGIAPAAD